MTLNTKMYVHDEVSPHDFFRGVQYLVGHLSDPVRLPDEQLVEDAPSFYRGFFDGTPDDAMMLQTSCGQGLSAWIQVQYSANGPYRAEEYTEHYDGERCDESCTPETHEGYSLPACHLELSLDTAYGYRGPDGQGCGDLHALILNQIGTILDEMGISWSWQNEFTGEIHQGYDGLDELGQGGVDALNWFKDSVVPVIEKFGELEA